MNFGSNLKMLRSNQMLSISKLAKKSDLSQSFICRIESGEKQPTLETLHKLSRGLGIGIVELLGEDLTSKSESPSMQRIVANIRKFTPEQIEALDIFISSISKGAATGETPLSLQEIQYPPPESEEPEMKLVFSANVSAVMEHRIPGGTDRNIACFQLFDDEKNQIPIEMIPGNQRTFGRNADKIFIVKPLTPLDDGKTYTLHISRLLQANNYRYLHENHTVVFTTSEILDITPYNKKLCSPYLSLALENCNLDPGSEDVAVDSEIALTFSNDVCSQAVREHNINCFALLSSKNQTVGIDVIMAEPNDHPEKKKEIRIRPRKPLSANSAYVLIISENLTGINQKRLGTDKMIAFSTGSTASVAKRKENNHSIA